MTDILSSQRGPDTAISGGSTSHRVRLFPENSSEYFCCIMQQVALVTVSSLKQACKRHHLSGTPGGVGIRFHRSGEPQGRGSTPQPEPGSPGEGLTIPPVPPEPNQ